MKSRLPILLFLALSSCSSPEVKAPDNTLVAELPPAASLNSSDLEAIRTAVEDKKIVMMGESLYMSSELPRTREKLVRNLHEAGDFSLLLFEGSPIEFWI